MENNEKLENTKERDEKIREVYASLYYNALDKAIKKYDGNESHEFQEEMDEEILEEIDECIEEKLEDVRPDLVVKRISGLHFLVINRDEYERKLDETEE